MRSSDHSPSIVPPGNDQDVYLVLDDFGGRLGQSWREADVEATRLETVLADLLDGQYSNPVRVVSFNTAEGWSRDVSEDVAHEVRLFRQACKFGPEGMVSKRRDRPYRSGRSPDWIKVKNRSHPSLDRIKDAKW
jgi:hypothetical protein